MLLATHWKSGRAQYKKEEEASSPHARGSKSHAKPRPCSWRSVAVPLRVTMVRGGSPKRAEAEGVAGSGAEAPESRSA